MKNVLGRIAVGLMPLVLAVQVASGQGPAAGGIQISAFMTVGVQSALHDLLPVYEKASGQQVVPTWGTAAMVSKRIQDGEGADVLIGTRATIDALIKAGRIVAGSDAVVANSRVGVAVRRGAPKPDISTPDALRKAVLAARAIAYSNPAAGGTSGVHFSTVLERLGIAEQVKAKTRFPPAGGLAATLLASGEADLAVQQMPELAAVEGSEVVGPLPAELQLVTTFVAGVPANAKQAEAGRAFLRFLRSPEAVAVMKAKGLEVPAPAPAR
jgi:molybdate transport system substrate-binding protein